MGGEQTAALEGVVKKVDSTRAHKESEVAVVVAAAAVVVARSTKLR